MKVAVVGVAGRMGRALVRLLDTHPILELSAAVARPGSSAVGRDAGELAGLTDTGVSIVDSLADAVQATDLVIDFSTPEATMETLRLCLADSRPVVIGTTGFTQPDLDTLNSAAGQLPIVLAPNMSVAVNLTFKLVEIAAKALGDEVDVEVIEAHHRHKVDAPSGTAVRMGEILADTLGRNLEQDAVYGRQGQTGPRERKTIGFSTIRGGEIIGEHTVMFAGAGERLELTHRAQSRDSFVEGALRAAMFVADKHEQKQVGLFDMQDVLGLR